MSYMRTLLVPGEGKPIAGLFGPRQPVNRALVLSGGGMDSYVAAHALRANFPKVEFAFVTFNYGQKNAALEAAFAHRQAKRLVNPITQTVRSFVLKDELPNALSKPTALSTAGRLAAKASGNEAANQDYVPFRNGRFLATAAGLAEAEGYDVLVFGAVGSVNPDNSLPFVEATAAMFAAGAHKRVQVYAPFTLLTKAAVVQFAHELELADGHLAEFTVSCFNATETRGNGSYDPATQCGVCRSCISLKQAFAFAQVPDPFYYEAK